MTLPNTCILVGGGGHAKVLIDCLQSAGSPFQIRIVDGNPALKGVTLMECPIVGGDEEIPSLVAQGATHFVIGIGAPLQLRRRIWDKMIALGLQPLTVIAPSAVCSRYAQLGPGCQLLPNSVVNAAAVLGANVIVNTGAIVEHDCVVGDHAHVASHGTLLGGSKVGVCSMVGGGAVVRQLVRVGDGAMLGAGAVAVSDVPDEGVFAGVPARAIAGTRQ